MIGCVMDEAHFPVGHFQLWRGRQQTFREWGLISLLAPRAEQHTTVALQKHTNKRKRREAQNLCNPWDTERVWKGCVYLFRLNIQGLAKRWSLGCVNPASWLHVFYQISPYYP